MGNWERGTKIYTLAIGGYDRTRIDIEHTIVVVY